MEHFDGPCGQTLESLYKLGKKGDANDINRMELSKILEVGEDILYKPVSYITLSIYIIYIYIMI